MKLRIVSSALVAAALLFLSSCFGIPSFHFGGGIRGSGDIQTESRSTEAFSGVENQTSGTVEIVQGSRRLVEVELDDNLLPHLVTRVEDDVLKIFFDRSVSGADLTVRIVVPTLSRAILSGSGEVTIDRAVEAESLVLVNAGSGSLEAEAIEAAALEVVASGSGDVEIESATLQLFKVSATGSGSVTVGGVRAESGQSTLVGSGSLRISGGSSDTWVHSGVGSGTLYGEELRVRVAQIDLAGSGSAYMAVTEALAAETAGSGSIYYGGNPDARVAEPGSGRVLQVD